MLTRRADVKRSFYFHYVDKTRNDLVRVFMTTLALMRIRFKYFDSNEFVSRLFWLIQSGLLKNLSDDAVHLFVVLIYLLIFVGWKRDASDLSRIGSVFCIKYVHEQISVNYFWAKQSSWRSFFTPSSFRKQKFCFSKYKFFRFLPQNILTTGREKWFFLAYDIIRSRGEIFFGIICLIHFSELYLFV